MAQTDYYYGSIKDDPMDTNTEEKTGQYPRKVNSLQSSRLAIYVTATILLATVTIYYNDLLPSYKVFSNRNGTSTIYYEPPLLSSVAVANSSSKAIAVRSPQSYDVDCVTVSATGSSMCETGKTLIGVSAAVVGAVASLMAAPVTGGTSVAAYVAAISGVSGSLLGFFTCENKKNLNEISSLMASIARAIYKAEAYDDAKNTAALWFAIVEGYRLEEASRNQLDSLKDKGINSLNEAKEAPIQGALLVSVIAEELAVIVLARITKATTGDACNSLPVGYDCDSCTGLVNEYFTILKDAIDFLEDTKQEREDAFLTGLKWLPDRGLITCNLVCSSSGGPCSNTDIWWHERSNYRADCRSTEFVPELYEREEICSYQTTLNVCHYLAVKRIKKDLLSKVYKDYMARITLWWNEIEPQHARLNEMYNHGRAKTLSLCGTF